MSMQLVEKLSMLVRERHLKDLQWACECLQSTFIDGQMVSCSITIQCKSTKRSKSSIRLVSSQLTCFEPFWFAVFLIRLFTNQEMSSSLSIMTNSATLVVNN